MDTFIRRFPVSLPSIVVKEPLLSRKRASEGVRHALPGELPLIAEESHDAVAVGLGETG